MTSYEVNPTTLALRPTGFYVKIIGVNSFDMLVTQKKYEELYSFQFGTEYTADARCFVFTNAEGRRLIYVGQLDPNTSRAEGVGIMVWDSGEIYQGFFRKDERYGADIDIYSGGDCYEGKYARGMRNGHGVYVFTNGEAYEGDWKDDKIEGIGRYEYLNGDSYEGEWRNGMKHGKGNYIHANGEAYDGCWREDKRHGLGTFTLKFGVTFIRERKDGEIANTKEFIFLNDICMKAKLKIV